MPIAQIASVIALNNFRCSLPLGYLTEIIDCCTSLSVLPVFWQQGSGNTLLDPLDGANGSAWRETRAGRMFSGRTGSVFIPPVVKARWCFYFFFVDFVLVIGLFFCRVTHAWISKFYSPDCAFHTLVFSFFHLLIFPFFLSSLCFSVHPKAIKLPIFCCTH